jgi:CRP-like cAMP-binding protein
MIAPATALSLREREAIRRQDDPATAFFIVVDGWIKLYRITVGGDEAVINLVQQVEQLKAKLGVQRLAEFLVDRIPSRRALLRMLEAYMGF